MSRRNHRYLTAILLVGLSLIGAEAILLKVISPKGEVAVVSDGTLSGKVSLTLSTATKSDRDYLWGMFTAGAEYLRSGHPGSESTGDFLRIWKRALKTSGWDREKYPGLTDLLEQELKQRGYDQSKELDPWVDDLSKFFEDVARGCRSG
jgi:hypothetical protein